MAGWHIAVWPLDPYGGLGGVRAWVHCKRDILRMPVACCRVSTRRAWRLAEGEPQGQQIHFELPVELANGVYANYALVHHSTEHELTIDFCQISSFPPLPDGGRVARVVARIHIAPTLVTSLLQAISTNAFRQEDALRQLEEGGQDEHTDEA